MMVKQEKHEMKADGLTFTLSVMIYLTASRPEQDCSMEELRLFASQCLSGPFGGQVSPAADYQCSAQSENSPDWFPFLCVTSPPENNPFLGFFYQGDTM